MMTTRYDCGSHPIRRDERAWRDRQKVSPKRHFDPANSKQGWFRFSQQEQRRQQRMKHSTSLRHLYHLFNETTLLLGLLFLVLVVVGEAFRRANLNDSLEFWTVIPPLLFPIWVHYWNTWDPILWIKTISLIPVAVIWCSIVRIGIDEYWTRLGSFLVLSTNIAEAVVKDALSKRERTTWNPLNALSGVLLIVSELPTLHTIRISEDGMREFLWSHGPSWIIGT